MCSSCQIPICELPLLDTPANHPNFTFMFASHCSAPISSTSLELSRSGRQHEDHEDRDALQNAKCDATPNLKTHDLSFGRWFAKDLPTRLLLFFRTMWCKCQEILQGQLLLLTDSWEFKKPVQQSVSRLIMELM